MILIHAIKVNTTDDHTHLRTRLQLATTKANMPQSETDRGSNAVSHVTNFSGGHLFGLVPWVPGQYCCNKHKETLALLDLACEQAHLFGKGIPGKGAGAVTASWQ